MHLDLLQLSFGQHVVSTVPTVPCVQVAVLAHEASYDVLPATVVATN